MRSLKRGASSQLQQGARGPQDTQSPSQDSFPENRGPWCPRFWTLRSEVGPLLERGPLGMVGSCPISTQKYTPAVGLCKVRRKDFGTNRAAGETQNKDTSACPPLGVFEEKDCFQGPVRRRGWKRGPHSLFCLGGEQNPHCPTTVRPQCPGLQGLLFPAHRPRSPPASQAPAQLFKGR